MLNAGETTVGKTYNHTNFKLKWKQSFGLIYCDSKIFRKNNATIRQRIKR
jgi:hypothetical protein